MDFRRTPPVFIVLRALRDATSTGKEEARVAWQRKFFFTKSFYRGCSEGLHTPPTTVPHVVPRAQQQQPAAGIPVKGTVYPRALNVAGSRHPSPILSYVRRTGSCGHDTQGLSRMHVATTLNLPRA